MNEAIRHIAEQVRAEHLKTGRDVREILESMRDEGYLAADDAVLDQVAEIVTAANEDRT